ncbi:MAG: 50S ribosomal protein L10 [Candidatus Woesearchaeota archaeon]|nr:50S ribosomal protein L10 [Candidatus Woesearchaeota archaeon]
MANVSKYKKKIVEDMVKLMRQYSIIGMVNMENMPTPQLQAMRSELRGKIDLFMTKKRLMRIAIEKLKDEKKNIEELEKYLEGMPALIFTNENPFKLSRILQKSKTKAPAKAGQIAPSDITIHKGPTPFAPGPIISELSGVGLKVGVESGKVAVKEDSVVAKKGEKINSKVAEILTRLDIKPMEVGLGLVAAYEEGVIYQKDILNVDEKEYNNNINLAAAQAFNLAFNITYVTKDNIPLLVGKAFNDAKVLGISQEILDKGIIEDLLGKAEMSMLSLKNGANIETKAVEVKEEPSEEKPETKEEKPKEQPKEEPIAKEKPQLKEEKPIEVKKEEIEEQKPQPKIEVKEEVEVKKEQPKPEIKEEHEKPEIKEKSKEEVDEKVSKMVEKTKKFMKGGEETAADIIEEVEKEEHEEKKEDKIEERELKDKTQVPSTFDLKKKKEEEARKEDKENTSTSSDLEKDKIKGKEQKDVEELTKELLKKGTLRKK